MVDSWLNFFAIALYLATTALFWRRLAGANTGSGAKVGAIGLGVIAVLLHAVILYSSMRVDGNLNLGFTNAVSLVGWVIAALFLVTALSKPIENLGIFIMPMAAATLLLAWAWPSRNIPIPYTSFLLFSHIIISILAYSLLSIAVVQSLMLSIQERHLRHKQPGGFMRTLPPMQTMEQLMFQLITLGFALLTLTLISGIFFSEAVFGKPLMFTHHIVLSIFAWLAFAILLVGRWRFGWRGRNAIRWTVSGFTLLALAYFGSKFVLEILLGR
jgi:ABC-type uncharacterized transport system permease subunit